MNLQVKIPVVSSCVAFAAKIVLGCIKFCGFAVKIPVGLKFVTLQDLGISQVCYSQVVASCQDSGWETSSFCGFAVKIPAGTPQTCSLKF